LPLKTGTRLFVKCSFRRRRLFLGLIAVSCALSSCVGCVQSTYRYGISNEHLVASLPQTPNVISVGGEHPNIDRLEKVVQYPRNVVRKWFPSKDPFEQLPIEERRQIAMTVASNYLDNNSLKGLFIDVREYDPGQQWQRLVDNNRVSPIWKYTLGSAYHLGYSILPGRAFGYDRYDPFTNTLSINSTRPSSALFTAGYVKKIYDQRYPGTYVAANFLPIMPLIRDTSIANDVLTYSHVQLEWRLKQELYPLVYGRLGGDVVSQATSLIPSMAYMPFYMSPLLTRAGRVTGRVAGTAIADLEEKKQNELQSSVHIPGNSVFQVD
jgi:hypothetical protein